MSSYRSGRLNGTCSPRRTCVCVWVAFDRQISFTQARPLGGVPRIVKRTFVLGAFLGCVPRGTEELHWRRGSRTSNESGPRITRGNPCCACVCVVQVEPRYSRNSSLAFFILFLPLLLLHTPPSGFCVCVGAKYHVSKNEHPEFGVFCAVPVSFFRGDRF